MAKKVTGLEPRGFRWVITGRLAISERIGGYGFQHRRVRREEEITWLGEHGINAVLSLLPGGNQNQAAYESAGFSFYTHPIEGELEDRAVVTKVFQAMDQALRPRGAAVLIHRDTIDDTLAGLLAGYLVHSRLVQDPIIATDVIQKIVGRPIGPEGRRLIPVTG
jgi:hypothetical protein